MNLAFPFSKLAARSFAVFGFMFVIAFPAMAAHTIVFPQYVTAGGYITTATFVNTNTGTTANGTLAIFNQDGSPRMTAIDGQPTGTSFNVAIPPGGNVVLTTSQAAGNAVSGMAIFTSDIPVGGVIRFDLAGNQVGVLSAPLRAFATLVVDNKNGNATGVAISNPGTTPLNFDLLNVDSSGNVLETISPPELNPLAPKAQIAKFMFQFAFTQVADRDDISVQIRPIGGGLFSAFGLLLKNNALASTATVKGASGIASALDLGRSYNGTWNNSTFGSSGGSNLMINYDPDTNLAVAVFHLTGNVFGSGPLDPIALFGTVDPNAVEAIVGARAVEPITLTANSDVFGPITVTISPPDPDADQSLWDFLFMSTIEGDTVRVEGKVGVESIDGAYTITFGSSDVLGTVSMKVTLP
jgi:hypothetical protein